MSLFTYPEGDNPYAQNMEEQEMPGIKPCPFCGQHLRFVRRVQDVFFHPGVVTDTDCFLSGRGVRVNELPNWNKREG